MKLFGEGSSPTIYFDPKLIQPGKGEKGCKRCQGVVFELEKVVAGNHWFHQVSNKCFRIFTKAYKNDAYNGLRDV